MTAITEKNISNALLNDEILKNKKVALNNPIADNAEVLDKILKTEVRNHPIFSANPELEMFLNHTCGVACERNLFVYMKDPKDPTEIKRVPLKFVAAEGKGKNLKYYWDIIEVNGAQGKGTSQTLVLKMISDKGKLLDIPIKDLLHDSWGSEAFPFYPYSFTEVPTAKYFVEKKINMVEALENNQLSKDMTLAVQSLCEEGLIDKNAVQAVKTSKTLNRAATLVEADGGGVGIVAFYIVDTLIRYAFVWTLVSFTAGVYGSGHTLLTLKTITDEQAEFWNKAHPDRKIEANAVLTPVETDETKNGPTSHKYSIRPKTGLGFDSQLAFNVAIDVLSEPFSRPEKVNDQDPALGKMTNDNKYDAAMLITFSGGAQINGDTNDLGDAASEAYQQAGIGSLHVGLLPSPDYQLTKITNTKTGNALYSQGSSSNSNSLIKASGWNNIQVGDIKGLAINTDQAVEMQVKIPKDEAKAQLGIKGDLYGNGLVAQFIEESSEGANTVDSVRSDYYEGLLKKQYSESHVLASPYLYNVYTCDYPTKIGDSCGFKMHIGGMDNSKHIGKIYLADGLSKTTAIPVYLNYHLLGSYFELNVSDKTSPYKIDIMNTHNEAYTKMTLEYKSVDDDSYKSVPMDMLAKDTTCNLDSGLQPQAQCSIYFDFSKIDSDSYQFRINGIKSTAKLGTPDQFDVKVRVN